MEVVAIPIDKIRPATFQPRETFDKEKIAELAESIRESGLIEPILVRKKGDTYQIIAGERRWRAWHEVGKNEIPAIIQNVEDKEAMELSLIENWQRVDLTSAEREKMVVTLWKTFGPDGQNKYKNHDELAKKLGAGTIKGDTIGDLIVSATIRKTDKIDADISTRTILDTRSLESDDRKKLIKRIESGEISRTADGVRQYARVIKEASEPMKEAILKSKSNITPEVAKKIMEIKDENVQEQIVKKIEREHIHEYEAATIIDVIKQAPESVKVAMLKPKSKITPEIAKKIIEFPKKEQQREIIKEIEKAQELEEEGIKAFVTDRLDIAKGTRAPDITIRDPQKRLVELYSRIYSDVTTISASHVKDLPRVHKQEAIRYMKGARDHLERELNKLNELKLIE